MLVPSQDLVGRRNPPREAAELEPSIPLKHPSHSLCSELLPRMVRGSVRQCREDEGRLPLPQVCSAEKASVRC